MLAAAQLRTDKDQTMNLQHPKNKKDQKAPILRYWSIANFIREEKTSLIKRNTWFGLLINVVAIILGLYLDNTPLLLMGVSGSACLIVALWVFTINPFLAFEITVIFFSCVLLSIPFFFGMIYSISLGIMAVFSATFYVMDGRPRSNFYVYFFLGVFAVYALMTNLLKFETLPIQPMVELICSLASFVILVSSFFSYRNFSKRIHRQVNQRRAMLDALLKSTNDIIWAVNHAGEVLACNEAAQNEIRKLFGAELVVGEKLFKSLPEEMVDRYGEQFQQVLNGQTFEITPQFTYNGKKHYYETRLAPIEDKNGMIIGCAIFSRDVTERVQTLDLLKASEVRFRTLFEYSPLGIVMRDVKSNRYTDINRKVSEMYGYEREELVGKDRQELIAWEDAHDYNELVERLVRKELSGFQNEKRFKRKDGSTFWARVNRTMVKIDGKEYLIGFVEDIDLEKRAEDAIKASERQYRLLFENAFDGLIIFDGIQQIPVDCNDKTLEYFKLQTKEELTNSNFLEFSPLTQANGQASDRLFSAYLTEVIKHGRADFEWEFQLEDGTKLLTDMLILRLHLDAKSNLFVAILRDITEKKAQEELLQKQMLELNETNVELQKYIDSNMQLENFAYMASHDLKAPLRTIISFSQLLESRAAQSLKQDELKYLQFIRQATHNLNELIHGLLTYSKVDANKAVFDAVNFKTLVRNILNELQVQIQEKKAAIYIKNLPEKIWGDAIRLRQLIQNLLNNALKFSRSDVPLEISIEAIDQGDFWELSIQDNGIGIKEEYFERIFLLFRRLHSNDQYEGAGIGLALCKKIVEQHKGRIWIESKYGEGTTFFIRLPLKRELVLQ